MVLLKDVFKKENRYWVFLALTMILCYGFALTNISMGVDDEGAGHIWGAGNALIINGRFGTLLLSLLFDITAPLPFWRDFIAVAVLACSATVFVTFLQACSGNRLSGVSQIIFACLFVSVPVIAFAFVYLLYVIEFAITLLLAGFALLFLWNWLQRKRWYFLLFAILLVAFGSSFYEHCVNHFVTGAMCGYLVSLKFHGQKSGKAFLKYILTVAVIALAALVILFVTAGILRQVILGGAAGGYALSVLNINLSASFIAQLLERIRILFAAYTYFKFYVFFTVVLFIICVWQSIKQRNLWVLITGALIILSTFMMEILQGSAGVPPRTMIVYAVYYGFAGLYLFESFTRKWIKNIIIFAIIVVVFYQSKEMNTIFYTDYMRYKLDVQRAYAVNEEITKLAGDNPEKPVVFIGRAPEYELEFQYPGEVVGSSAFAWDGYFGIINNPRITGFMALEGMRYNEASPEEIEAARDLSYFMPDWPKEGSVAQTDKFVVVRFSSPQYAVLDGAEAQSVLDATPAADGPGYSFDRLFDDTGAMIEITGGVRGAEYGAVGTQVHIMLYAAENTYLLPAVTEMADDGGNDIAFVSRSLPVADIVAPGRYNIILLLEHDGNYMQLATDEYIDIII